ncbi:MAG: EAL domain-containing protein [Actinomycetota bacterium]|nr:EAL domain-containing protein [Actinomycetota bacterium]
MFRPALDREPWSRTELDTDLHAALEQEQFRLVYQPIYGLADLTLIGVEALIRWQHPTRGELAPQEFIPALESSGEILEVGRWVLVQACIQMQLWRTAGSDLSVSVNVSARQLDTDDIIDDVRDALTASGLPATALTLEITETALMRDLDAITGRLNQLKQLGVQIALDDFGTGYSSLAYLQRFPVDTLKIDGAFINAISRSRDSDAIIRTLVQLGHDLGVRTVAEGVETTHQLDHVRRQGVDEVQGFLLSKPLDADSLDRLVLQPIRQLPASAHTGT